MVHVLLYIGPDPAAGPALRQSLSGGDIYLPQSLGKRSHTKLVLAALDPDHVDPIRAARGLSSPKRHSAFADRIRTRLAKEIAAQRPEKILLICDLAARLLTRPSEVARLRALLEPWASRIDILAACPPLPQALATHWSDQILWGRSTPLEADLEPLRQGAPAPPPKSYPTLFPELDAPPFGLTQAQLAPLWDTAEGRFHSAPDPAALLAAADLPPLTAPLEKAIPLSWASLARIQRVNQAIREAERPGYHLPRPARAALVREMAEPGTPLDPKRIERALIGQLQVPILPPASGPFDRDAFTATLTPLLEPGHQSPTPPTPSTAEDGASLADRTARIRTELRRNRLTPHNRTAPPSPPEESFPPAPLRQGQSERVLIACVKDEGPYLLEWLAHHRAIGFDHFLIYSNDCSDGTDRILDRLAKTDWLTHIDNSKWHGRSPQQAALNHAITLPLVQQAQWVLHSDLDEFVNIRCGDGTLDALFAACPDATHFALTWRLFGSAGVRPIQDQPVMAQFTRCAPAFCPKPHTAWGFKTLGRQIGLYAKLSCHRPTKPDPEQLSRALWVNGAGQPMKPVVAERGWRTDARETAYDLVQLNHYALRSRDSFLVKRKRGRALHVDRQIGANYWMRMDWNDVEDRSILRHLARMETVRAEIASLPKLAKLHSAALAWHRDRAEALRSDPDWAVLIEATEAAPISALDRAALATALSVES